MGSTRSGGTLARLTGVRKWVALLLLGALSPVMLNCYGGFPLTRAVHRINGTVPTGLLQTIVFWVFLAVPVYSVAMIADAVVFNLIEFWTGGAIAASSTTDANGTTVSLTPSSDGQSATLTVQQAGKPAEQVLFVRVSDVRCEVRDADENLLGVASRTADGGLTVTDANGRMLCDLSPQEVGSLQVR